MRHRLVAVVCFLASSSSLLEAGDPPPLKAGAEFRINTNTTGSQYLPAVSADRNGNFVVTWGSYPALEMSETFAKRFAADGTLQGVEFQVNTYTTGFQTVFDIGEAEPLFLPPSVAHDARGNFVIVWTSAALAGTPQDGDGPGVFGQRFTGSGAPLGAEFPVNSTTTGGQFDAEVAAAPNGSFVVVWSAEAPTLDDQDDIRARRFDAFGNPIGGEFFVNTTVVDFQTDADVAVAPDGSFVVVWMSGGQDGSNYGIFGRRFDATGTPAGAEFPVNTYTTSDQSHPQVATDAAGNFVVVWHSNDQFGPDSLEVVGQRFSAAGIPQGGEFQVNTFTTGAQFYSSVARNAWGDFVVVWMGEGAGKDFGVFGQRFEPSGVKRGPEFRVSTTDFGYEGLHGVASDPVGNFVATWMSLSSVFPPSQDSDVFAQRYGGLLPAALRVDSDPGGNNVFEPGEAVDVRPSWLNVNGQPQQQIDGSLLQMTGPGAPSIYEIHDGEAVYGTINDGATSECMSNGCYHVGVVFSGTRPARHWDSTLVEGLLPDEQGQRKMWSLHLGDSFTDVPTTNGFYRGIETMLHHGVTSGCGLSGDRLIYCPTQSTTREQMAKFVLASKEGPLFAPRPCGALETRIFADVPASNGFCPWIEELFRRGVVNGCALDPLRYCPANTVTREQMAKFVLLTLDPALVPPPCTSGSEVFADVPASSGFCPYIEELFNRQVVNGCALDPLRYCPTNPVTREQMSKFLGLTFELELYGP